MVTKVFHKKDTLELISDERDISLPAYQTKEIDLWCTTNDIKYEFVCDDKTQAFVQRIFNVRLWRVRDPDERMLFVLKWGL